MQILKYGILSLLLAVSIENIFNNFSLDTSISTEQQQSAFKEELCDKTIPYNSVELPNRLGDISGIPHSDTHDKKSYIRLFIYTEYRQRSAVHQLFEEHLHWMKDVKPENLESYIYTIRKLLI